MQQWRPSDLHCLKINFDAAVFRRSSLAGIGVVVRNNAGEVEGALSSSISMAQSVADLEALACLKAVQFALELGITRVVFEGDSAVVINALLHGAGAFASFDNILDDIRMLSAVFHFVDFVFVFFFFLRGNNISLKREGYKQGRRSYRDPKQPKTETTKTRNRANTEKKH